jgi:adenosine kinase
VSIAVTGSIATDHQMVFPGRFANDFLPGQSKGPLSGATMSMVVDSLDIRPGGVAANIAFGLGRLGHRPALVGAVGADFGEYRGWLERHGVDTTWLRISATRSTARLLSTVDAENNRMVSLYAGALAEAHAIELSAVSDLDLVMIAPGNARTMLAHADECRRLGYRFAVDPVPQLGRVTAVELRSLVDGADYVFASAASADRLLAATGWTRAELLAHVGTWVVTLGADGVRLEGAGTASVQVAAVPGRGAVDKHGVADAFRAGFLSGLGWRLSPTRSAQVGCLLAALALETRGSQDYQLDPDTFVKRLDEAYGPVAAADVDGRLTPLRPAEDHWILGYN